MKINALSSRFFTATSNCFILICHPDCSPDVNQGSLYRNIFSRQILLPFVKKLRK